MNKEKKEEIIERIEYLEDELSELREELEEDLEEQDELLGKYYYEGRTLKIEKSSFNPSSYRININDENWYISIPLLAEVCQKIMDSDGELEKKYFDLDLKDCKINK